MPLLLASFIRKVSEILLYLGGILLRIFFRLGLLDGRAITRRQSQELGAAKESFASIGAGGVSSIGDTWSVSGARGGSAGGSCGA